MPSKKTKKRIPGFFEHQRKIESHAVPLFPFAAFTDREDQLFFKISKKIIPAQDFRTANFAKNTAGLEGQQIDYNTMKDFPVVVSHAYGRLIIAHSGLHLFTSSRQGQKAALEIVGRSLTIHLNSAGMVEFRDIASGSILAPAQQSYCLETPEEKGFSEYAFFNDKSREERLRLLAGLGLLARAAAKAYSD